MWRFAIGRDALLHAIWFTADPVDKLLLYDEFNLDAEEFLVDSMNELAKEPETPTKELVHSLGEAHALKLMRIRDSFDECTDSYCRLGCPDVLCSWDFEKTMTCQCRRYKDHKQMIREIYGITPQ